MTKKLISFKNISFFSILLFLISSCGNSSNDSNQFFFKNHQEILDEYISTISPDYLISQSSDNVKYEREVTENEFTTRVKVYISKNTRQYIEDKVETISDKYRGEITIKPVDPVDGPSHYSTTLFNFYLPSGEEISLKNIIKFNKYDFNTGFIEHDERLDNYPIKSFFGIDKKVMNGIGEFLMFDKVQSGYYMKNLLKDTIEYYKIKDFKKNSKYFRKNIVHSRFNDTKEPLVYNGEVIKYIEYEGVFNDDQKIGEHIQRENGIVTDKILFDEPGRWVSHKEYFLNNNDLYFESIDSLFIPKVGNSFLQKYESAPDLRPTNSLFIRISRNESVGHVWSNQDKLDIVEDSKGYKSYTPQLMLVKNRIGIKTEESDSKSYVYHGKYEKFDFFYFYPVIYTISPTKQYFQMYELKQTVSGNYSNGYLEGNLVTLDETYGLENFNGLFKKGQLIQGTYKEYDTHYYNSDRSLFVKREYVIDQNGLKWKEFNYSGETVDEGFKKINPNEYFYGDLEGLDLDFNNKGYEIRKNSQ